MRRNDPETKTEQSTPDPTANLETLALLAKAIAGDLDAAAAILGEVGTSIRSEIRGKIPSRFQSSLDADDVMQVSYLEALLRFADGAFAGSEIAALRAWFRTIAEHNLTDAIRGLSRQKRTDPARRLDPKDDRADRSRSAFTEDLFAELLSVSQTPSRAAAAREAEALLGDAIDSLPADYATVIQLGDLDGLGMTEVATRTGRSVGAIHMLRFRARERLRAELGRANRYFTETGD